ncbi:hypothetical protein DFH29DRAFT_613596 [Suillus ampliporus]|nr:hypothetical protein DFH29DRAFT_613596 [Suillus ampliporus]
MDMSYDVVIGHSLGGSVTLALMPFLPKTKETTIILLDPGLEITAEQAEMIPDIFTKEVAHVRTADEYMAENNAWSRRDCVLRVLGLSMCNPTDVEATVRSNAPCSSGGLLKNIPPNVTITVLASDPEHRSSFRLEHIPRDVERLNVRFLTSVGHWIQYERPDAIMDVIPLPRAKL